MIVLSIASAIYLVALQNAAANNSRDQLMSCLDETVTKGKTASIAADAFVGFARGQCGAPATSLKSALVAFDVKNKISRKQAEADAESQIDEFVTMTSERYAAQARPR